MKKNIMFILVPYRTYRTHRHGGSPRIPRQNRTAEVHPARAHKGLDRNTEAFVRRNQGC